MSRAIASLFTFAFAVVVAFALLSINTWLGDVLASTWAFVVFPGGALLVRRAAVPAGERDAAPDYWRTGDWQSGAR